MRNLQPFVEYIIIGITMLTGAIVYITILWSILRIWHKIPSPFSFDKNFWTELKKFGTVYFIGDILLFVIEGLIVGFTNAIVLRTISIILTITKGGFFGWFRNFMVRKFHKPQAKTPGLRKYIGDTSASIIFWVPIYVLKLSTLYAFELITTEKIMYAMILSLASTIFFGRIACFFADLFEKHILHKKPQHTYSDPLGEFGFKTK